MLIGALVIFIIGAMTGFLAPSLRDAPWSDDPQEAMDYVKNGIDVILTNAAHALIAGGFHPSENTPAGPALGPMDE